MRRKQLREFVNSECRLIIKDEQTSEYVTYMAIIEYTDVYNYEPRENRTRNAPAKQVTP